jgi:hypothetical protein
MPERRDWRRVAILAALGIGWLAIVMLTARHGLNGDIEYVLGGFEVRGGGVGAAVDTFVHRPLTYRLVMGGLDSAVRLLGLTPQSQVPYETAVRAAACLLVAATAWVLFVGLRRRLGSLQAGAIAAASATALIAAPNWHFLQPEWVASLLVVAGVAAALAPRNGLVAAALSGALLIAAVGAKLATAPYALIGVGLILLLDRRRAAGSAIGGAVAGVLALLALLAMPVERQWVIDMIALNPNSPMRAGFTTGDLRALAHSLGSVATTSPAVLLLPATAVLLTSTVHGWHDRAALVAIGLGCVLLAVSTVVVQGAYYLYHYSILPVLAAAVAAAAAARWLPRTPLVGVAVAVALALGGVVGLWMLVHDATWRAATLERNLWLLIAVAGLATAGAALAVAAESRRPGLKGPALPANRGGRFAAGAAIALLASAALLPVLPLRSAWSLAPSVTAATGESWASGARKAHDTLADLSARIGRDAPVLYLAYGTVPYHMGNPTDCAYPSPVWLLTSTRSYVPDLPSFADNARCLRTAEAEWLIEQPGWLDPTTLPAELQRLIADTYDCESAIAAGSVRACPRRTSAPPAAAALGGPIVR